MFIPQKIFIFLKTPNNIEIQKFDPKNGPSLRMYEYIRVPPPPPLGHTHTHTMAIHVRLSAPGFGAHRICACADPVFHFFRQLISQRGPYA